MTIHLWPVRPFTRAQTYPGFNTTWSSAKAVLPPLALPNCHSVWGRTHSWWTEWINRSTEGRAHRPLPPRTVTSVKKTTTPDNSSAVWCPSQISRNTQSNSPQSLSPSKHSQSMTMLLLCYDWLRFGLIDWNERMGIMEWTLSRNIMVHLLSWVSSFHKFCTQRPLIDGFINPLVCKPYALLYAREAQERARFYSIQPNTAAGDFSVYVPLSGWRW